MRRLLALLLLAATLCSAASAAAALKPIRRTFGDTTVPQLRAGVVPMPASRANGRVTVIARLKLPPLAAAFAARQLMFASRTRSLDASSASSRAYLARVDAAQRVALAELHRAIPEARAGRRFRIVLDAITVTLPAQRLDRLARLSSVSRLYRTTRFTMELNRSPSIIGADELRAASGARGDGIKIGVVDDGVDPANPFFDPSSYSYPAGFPRGNTQFTTPKVIVARTFPGPGSGAPGNLPVDRAASFHGTHVAGIAAGNGHDSGCHFSAIVKATCGPPGIQRRALHHLQLPRVFTVLGAIGPASAQHHARRSWRVQSRRSPTRMNVISHGGGWEQPSRRSMIRTGLRHQSGRRRARDRRGQRPQAGADSAASETTANHSALASIAVAAGLEAHAHLLAIAE